MILERKFRINVHNLRNQEGESLFKNLSQNIAGDDNLMKNLAELLLVYASAMKLVSTKLETLDDELYITQKHNPIHHIECRLKNPPSIFDKMQRYGVAVSLESAREHIRDIAGIRVICNFIDDIYAVEKRLLNQSDVSLVKRKNYITEPKVNGYRSLHIIVKVPVFLSERTEYVPVEIQLRTIAMDYWASLEHTLRYKNNENDMQKFSTVLFDCANTLAATEKTMQYIQESIEN